MSEQGGSREKGVGSREWGGGRREGSREWGVGNRGETPNPHSPLPTPHSPLPTAHSPAPTPGETAYAAFDAAFPADRFVRLTWDEQAPAVQAAWEAAAQAVQDRVMQDLLAGGAKARQERQDRRAADAC